MCVSLCVSLRVSLCVSAVCKTPRGSYRLCKTPRGSYRFCKILGGLCKTQNGGLTDRVCKTPWGSYRRFVRPPGGLTDPLSSCATTRQTHENAHESTRKAREQQEKAKESTRTQEKSKRNARKASESKRKQEKSTRNHTNRTFLIRARGGRGAEEQLCVDLVLRGGFSKCDLALC